MSSLQFRIWKKMVRLIQDFYEGKMLFHSMVGNLQKDLEQAGLEDKELVRQWYERFLPLEEADSEAWYEMKDFDFEGIQPALQKMRDFLMEQELLMVLASHAHHPKISHSRR